MYILRKKNKKIITFINLNLEKKKKKNFCKNKNKK